MHKKILRAAACLLMLPILSGCVNHIELDKLAIVEAVGIDRDESGCTVTVQYFNTDSSGGVTAIDSSAPNAVTVSGHGSSIESALESVSYISGKAVMLGSAQLIVFGRGAASSVRDSLNFAASHYSGNQRAYITVTDGTAADIMKVKFSEGNASADKLESIIKNTGSLGLARPVMLYEAMEKLCEPTESLVLPLLKVTSDEAGFTEDGKNIVVGGGALCTADMLADTLSPSETSGILFLCDSAAGGGTCRMSVSYHGKTVQAELYGISSRIIPSFTDDTLLLRVEISASCEYISSGVRDAEASKEEIEALCQKEVEKRIAAALEKTLHGYGADTFGLAYKIRACSPEMWDALSDDYREHLKNSHFAVSCKINTERFGMIHG